MPNCPVLQDRMVNSAGRAYSRSFGFGLLNASRLVAMAKGWSTVASQLIVETQGPVDDAGNASSTAAPGRNISQAVDVAGQIQKRAMPELAF